MTREKRRVGGGVGHYSWRGKGRESERERSGEEMYIQVKVHGCSSVKKRVLSTLHCLCV